MDKYNVRYCVLRYKANALWHVYGPFDSADDAINWAEDMYGPFLNPHHREEGDYWEVHQIQEPFSSLTD